MLLGILLFLSIGVVYFSFNFWGKTNIYPNQENKKARIGDFTLLDHQGNIQSLYRNADSKYVVLIAQANDCPIVQKYSQTIHALKDHHYSPDKVSFFMINANRADDRISIIKEDADYNYGGPILLDSSQIISENLS